MGTFGKFGESSVIRQTLTSQNLAYKWYPYIRNLSIPHFYRPISFSLAICQTFNPDKHSHYTVFTYNNDILYILQPLRCNGAIFARIIGTWI